MRRGYGQYPGETFRYGRPNITKDGGAAEGGYFPLFPPIVLERSKEGILFYKSGNMKSLNIAGNFGLKINLTVNLRSHSTCIYAPQFVILLWLFAPGELLFKC